MFTTLLRRVPANTVLALLIGLIFLVAAGVSVILVTLGMRRQALTEAESKAQMLLDHNLATHAYFTHELKPDLFEFTKAIVPPDYFDPIWMSSTYAVRGIDTYFHELTSTDYYYKECAINARSPQNEADDYERTFLEEINANPAVQRRSNLRTLNGKLYLAVMRRGEVMEEACIRCHSTPERAPADLVKRYGGEGSFDRHAGDVVSAASIRIPIGEAYANVGRFSLQLSSVLIFLLLTVLVGLHWANNRFLVAPLALVRDAALRIANADEYLGARIEKPAARELGELVDAFNTMSTSLKQDRDKLEERVKERTTELQAVNDRLRVEISERRAAVEALWQSRQMLQLVLDTIPVRVFWKDTQLNYLGCNQVFARDAGLETPEEIVGKSDYDFGWRGLAEQYRKDDFEILRSGTPKINYEEAAKTATNEVRWARMNKIPLRTRSGEAIGVLSMSEDITEAKRAEEERERLITELSSALTKINTLSGLLPICASCKKIRDSHGQWKNLESYIRMHSEAEFSHSICPECSRQLYPEFQDEN